MNNKILLGLMGVGVIISLIFSISAYRSIPIGVLGGTSRGSSTIAANFTVTGDTALAGTAVTSMTNTGALTQSGSAALSGTNTLSGTTALSSTATTTITSNLAFSTTTLGIVLRSPNGACFRISVADTTGAYTTSTAVCP